jgi:ferredoxin
MSLRVEVDRELCMGSAFCLYWAEGAFALDEEEKAVVVDALAVSRTDLDRAVVGCPSQAISVEEIRIEGRTNGQD